MLTKRICLVLGAGASLPYGFPTGGELLDYIKGQQPDEWWPLARELFSSERVQDDHERLVSTARRLGSESIDHLVGKQTRFREYAKALVAYRISQGETPPRVLQAGRDWHNFLIRHATDEKPLNEVTPISVVTFNFDRSFEEATLGRLAAAYELVDDTEAEARARVAKVLRTWPIVHVHGSLGALPELASNEAVVRPYRQIKEPGDLALGSQGVTLLDDAVEDSPDFTRARELICAAEVVLFLGFAFHRLNCKRVIPRAWGADNNILYATSKGMSVGAVNKAKERFYPSRSLQTFDEDSLKMLEVVENAFSN